MSARYTREALLVCDRAPLALRTAFNRPASLNKLNHQPSPVPCGKHVKPPSTMSTIDPLKRSLLDNYLSWSYLDQSLMCYSPEQPEEVPNRPTPAELSYIFLKLREEVATVYR